MDVFRFCLRRIQVLLGRIQATFWTCLGRGLQRQRPSPHPLGGQRPLPHHSQLPLGKLCLGDQELHESVVRRLAVGTGVRVFFAAGKRAKFIENK